jgi:pimeloyl-ACP methyl ester carboxylesterase
LVRRGHGRAADTDEPFHYDDLATEAIGVLEQVVGGPAHIVGWSDGGTVGLHVAVRRPDLVDRMVVIGANFRFDGATPVDGDPELLDMLRDAYVERPPDGEEHFETHVGKAMAMARCRPSRYRRGTTCARSAPRRWWWSATTT